jgi:carotenoid cleavage dioxygenase
VIQHAGKLLALKEDSLPYAMDPDTLETLGVWDFDGQIKSLTFTAHPKICPKTGHMLCFAYEAKGEGTPDIAYFEIDADGRLLRETWFQGPHAAMIHDFAVTENHVVFPLIPLTVDTDRMRQGGPHFQWQPDVPQWFGVLPRAGNASSIRWYRGPVDHFQGHTLNAFEAGRQLHVDMPVTSGNVFYFFPQADGHVPPIETLRSCLMRWTFDLDAASDEVTPVPLTSFPCEFPRCDERYTGQPYSHGFMLGFDPSLPFDGASLGAPPFQFFNQLVHLNLATGATNAWFPGDAECFQEPIFVPRSAQAPEGDGYLIALLNHLRGEDTELVILDTQDLSAGPVARVQIPVRMRMSLHGNWSPA